MLGHPRDAGPQLGAVHHAGRPGLLTLHAEAPDPGSLARIQDLVAGRLEKFGHREQLAVTWKPVQAPGPVLS